MKKILKVLCCILAAVMLLIPFCFADDTAEVNILFTHDIHSHLAEFPSESGMIGGFGRLKTLIDQNTTDATFLLDGGDFSMGTLFQTAFETHASELTMMGVLGYDATTIGNHEFDYRSVGFANMLNSAKENGGPLPALLSANIDWSKSTDDAALNLKAALDHYGSTGYTIIDRDGVRLGVFGLMGLDSQRYAPQAGVEFLDCVETAKAMVAQLQSENADIIVCLSHSGTFPDPKESEDELLAKAVPEIDVIISGHTHSTLAQPIVYGSTYIVSAGEYGQNLGQIVLAPDGSGRWTLSKYQLHPTDSGVVEDAGTLDRLEEYKGKINDDYLSLFGYSFDDVLCQNSVNFHYEGGGETEAVNWGMGDLMADSLVYAVTRAEGESYEKVTMAIVPTGVVRDILPMGDVTVSDAFNILSLGIGKDRLTGYPLVSIYLTGEELLSVAEVDASVSSLMGGTKLYVSGSGWVYNSKRLILNRATDVWEYNDDDSISPVEKDKLYRVVADLFSAQMLGAVKSKSYGLLSLEPKDENGAPITDFEERIIYDQNGSEVKEWAAFASYLAYFGGEDGKGEIDESYSMPSNRIMKVESVKLGDLLRNPKKIFWVLCLAVLVILVIIAAVVVLVIKHKRKKAKV